MPRHPGYHIVYPGRQKWFASLKRATSFGAILSSDGIDWILLDLATGNPVP